MFEAAEHTAAIPFSSELSEHHSDDSENDVDEEDDHPGGGIRMYGSIHSGSRKYFPNSPIA